MGAYVKRVWLGTSLKKKLGIYVCLVILIIGVSAVFSFLLMDFTLGNFKVILNDNSKCYDFHEAMALETQAFKSYTRNRTEENRERYEQACQRTGKSLRQLPFDYRTIRAERGIFTMPMSVTVFRGMRFLSWDRKARDISPVCTRSMRCRIICRRTPAFCCS